MVGEWISLMAKNYKDPHIIMMSPLSDVAAEAEKEHIMKGFKINGGKQDKGCRDTLH